MSCTSPLAGAGDRGGDLERDLLFSFFGERDRSRLASRLSRASLSLESLRSADLPRLLSRDRSRLLSRERLRFRERDRERLRGLRDRLRDRDRDRDFLPDGDFLRVDRDRDRERERLALPSSSAARMVVAG